MGDAVPQTPWDLSLSFSRMDVFCFTANGTCRTIERLDRRVGQRRDATRAPIQARNGWRPHGRRLGQPAAPSKDSRNFVQTMGSTSTDNPYKVASQVYVGVLSQPQLYQEGNHRTGSLLASGILLKNGCPPFVLTRQNAVAYFNPSSEIKFTDKRTIRGRLCLPKYRNDFRDFLRQNVNEAYVRRP